MPGYRLLAGFVDGAEHCRKFVQKLENEPFLSSHGVDPLDDCTLEWIFGRMMRHGGVEGEAIEYVREKATCEMVLSHTLYCWHCSTHS